jgi:hypothetical protein
MTKPRYAQVSLAETPWYHIVSRCVRRAFLCGVDSRSGQSYEHRREWVEKRIKQLAAMVGTLIGPACRANIRGQALCY